MDVAKNSIFPPHEVFYIESMLFNSQSAVQSINVLRKFLLELYKQPVHKPIDTLTTQWILNETQNIMVQGAGLSRYFWPAGSKYEERGRYLREAFGITKDSPIYDRGLRNSIEHFDEKLDEYLKSYPVGSIFPGFVGPSHEEDGVPKHYLRAYFIDTGVFQILKNNIQPDLMIEEILRINKLLVKMLSNGRFAVK